MQEKAKLVLTIVLGALVSGALVTVVYLGNSKVAEATVKTASLDAKIAEHDDKLRQVPELRKQVEHLSEVVVRYERILPNERELVNIVNFFNDARRGAGVASLSSSPVTQKPRGRNVRPLPYEKHSFEIKFSSSFEEFVRFVNLLETQPRFMQVEAFALTPRGKAHPVVDGMTGQIVDDTGDRFLEANITVSTYRFDPASAQPSKSRSKRSRRSK